MLSPCTLRVQPQEHYRALTKSTDVCCKTTLKKNKSSVTACFIDQPFPMGFSETFTAIHTFSEKMLLSLNRYVAFDFHKECSRMRWDRLQILMDQLAEQQDEFR